MVQRFYTYDSTARRQLESKGLLEHYKKGAIREYYLDVAKEVWGILNAGSKNQPLPADVFQTLAEFLRRNDQFIKELQDHNVDIDRSFLKWPGYFAAMIVEEDWADIKSGEGEM